MNPRPAYLVTFSPAPFNAVTVKPCTVLEIFETTRTAHVELTGFRGMKITTYVNFADLASTPENAVKNLRARLENFHSAPDEKSATHEMAGACAE